MRKENNYSRFIQRRPYMYSELSNKHSRSKTVPLHLDNFKIQFKIYVCFVGSDFFPKNFFVLVIFWHEKNWL